MANNPTVTKLAQDVLDVLPSEAAAAVRLVGGIRAGLYLYVETSTIEVRMGETTHGKVNLPRGDGILTHFLIMQVAARLDADVWWAPS